MEKEVLGLLAIGFVFLSVPLFLFVTPFFIYLNNFLVYAFLLFLLTIVTVYAVFDTKRIKAIILNILLLSSPIPITLFFFSNYDRTDIIIGELFFGQSHMIIKNGLLQIYSNSMRLFPISLKSFEVVVLVASVVTYFLCLAFIARILYKQHNNKQKNDLVNNP
jgi:hypothetical protein